MTARGAAPNRRFGIVAALLAAVAILALGIYALPPEMKVAMAQNLERRVAGLRLGSVEAGGIRFSYLVGGEGEPVLLLHGFGGDKDHWTRFARSLTGSFHVVSPDLPGFGESSRDPRLGYGVDAQVERLHAFAEAIGLEAFHLGGNSMGGMIAARYAATHPEQVKSLALFAPGGVRGAKPSELQQLWDAGRNPLLVEDAAGFGELMRFVFAEPPWVPQSILAHLAARAVHERPLREKILGDLRADASPLEASIEKVRAPVLVVWGDRDRLLDVSGAEVIRSLVPAAEIDVLPGVGHCPMIERPAETAKLFRDFATATGS